MTKREDALQSDRLGACSDLDELRLSPNYFDHSLLFSFFSEAGRLFDTFSVSFSIQVVLSFPDSDQIPEALCDPVAGLCR